MPTADVTLRPNGTDLNQWTINGGAASAHAALSDDSDTTYLDNAVGGGPLKVRLTLTNVSGAVPADAKIAYVRVRIRWRKQPASGNPWVTVRLHDVADSVTWWDSGQVKPATESFVTDAFPWAITTQGGQEWTVAMVDEMRISIGELHGSVTDLDIAEVYVDVDWNERPEVTADGPTGTVDTSLPTVEWTYTDAEPDPQQAFRVVVVADGVLDGDAVAAGDPGFDPDTVDPGDVAHDSGELVSASASHTVTDPLANLTTYHAYVQVRQAWYGPGFWSLWDSVSFDTDMDIPPVPSLTVTPDPDTATVVLDVSSAAPGVDEVEPGWYQVEADWGDGVWVEVRGAAIDGRELEPDASRSATVIDREAPFNTAVSYRARAGAEVTGSIVIGPWSTTKLATLANDLRWLTDPLDADVGGSVWADRVERGFVPGRQHVHIPAGSGKAVVESEPSVQRIVVEGLTFDDDSYATMETVLRSSRTLLYRDRRLRAYVRWEAGRDLAPRFHDQARIDRWSGLLVEVARPSP